MKTFYGPEWAWDMVWETLDMDSKSTAFDPILRDKIAAAVAAIYEEGNDE
jgi:hypothetical protein